MKSPAFQLYAADYYMDTNSWSIEEMGIYQRLLLTQWSNGALPNDPARLARIAGCSVKKFQKSWTIIKVKFIPTGNGHLINKRLEEEREKQSKFRELQSIKGKKSASARVTTVQPRLQPEGQPKVNSSIFNLQSSNNLIKANNKVMEENEPQSEIMASLKTILDKTKERYPNQRDQQKILVFVQANLRNKNHNAILHCIESLVKNKGEVKAISQYLEAALKIENGKFNAAESEKKNNDFKRSEIPKQVGDIIKTIGKEMPAVN